MAHHWVVAPSQIASAPPVIEHSGFGLTLSVLSHRLEQFVPKFTQTMNEVAVGELSEPFLSQYGWHVLEVQERRRQDMGEEARRDKAVEILHRRRFDEELQKWLKEIRDEAFVEVRLGQRLEE